MARSPRSNSPAAILIQQLPRDQLLTVVAGDFNRSRSDDHMANVESLRQRGLVSAYHAHHRVEHTGFERHPTLTTSSTRRAATTWTSCSSPLTGRLRRVEVGTFEEYVEPRRGDHVPVVVSIETVAPTGWSNPIPGSPTPPSPVRPLLAGLRRAAQHRP
jgi:endonuclease/exonuclease/phosphatase family metal-dependent hydrolase